MSLPFRIYHAVNILEGYEQQNGPLDRFINAYLRRNKAIGSHDRREVGALVYGIVRWRGLVEALYPDLSLWKERIARFNQIDPLKYVENEQLSPHVRCGLPRWIYDKLAEAYGEKQAFAFGLINNTQAPTTVRVNTSKISRDTLLARWAAHYPVAPCKRAPDGIQFDRRVKLFDTPEYREGLFELQDEGSQLAAQLVDVRPGQSVLDYCAGAGGKSLAIAPKMRGRGQLYLHDVRRHALYEARRRLRRAGVQNVQFLPSKTPYLRQLRGKLPWVIADVPCSGSGTWRRNPDGKWRFTVEQLNRITDIQSCIAREVVNYLAPGGRLVYVTCSLFPEENEQQIEMLADELSLTVEGEYFRTFPEEGGPDGFFGAVLAR